MFEFEDWIKNDDSSMRSSNEVLDIARIAVKALSGLLVTAFTRKRRLHRKPWTNSASD